LDHLRASIENLTSPFYFRLFVCSFDVEVDGRFEQHKSTLIGYGESNGDSAMSKTVGITVAIGAELVLQSAISQRGVVAVSHNTHGFLSHHTV
jgi:saccharopine dehydrogenase-like NADP-dependent oxidoreductase